MSEFITWKNTGRGFSRGDFKDRYDARCSIQKSSLATEDCIWLGTDSSTGEPTRMHLTREMAGKLGHLLLKFSYTGELG